jgi:hypothetical protein
MMTMAPPKPPTTSSQRTSDTRSPSTVAASSVMASGDSETMDVNSATGM